MSSEEIKEIKQQLAQERDSYQEILGEMRKARLEQTRDAFEKSREYILKIAELSFIFGAAIGPLLIASKTEISQPVFIFLSITLYLINGFIILVKYKDVVEANSNNATGLGLGLEAEILLITNAINKLILNYEDPSNKIEYLKTKKDFIDKRINEPQQKMRVSFLFDIILTIFIWASLLLIKVIWPFANWAYWAVFVAITVVLFILSVVSYVRFIKTRFKQEADLEKISSARKDFYDWQEEEIYKK